MVRLVEFATDILAWMLGIIPGGGPEDIELFRLTPTDVGIGLVAEEVVDGPTL